MGLKLIAMGCLMWSAGCHAETITAANDNERVVLRLIRAAEAGNRNVVAKLASGVMLSDPVYGGSEPLTLDHLTTPFPLDHLTTYKSFVIASWRSKDVIQGVSFSFKFNGGRIVSVTHTPEE